MIPRCEISEVVATLRGLEGHPVTALRRFFDSGSPTVIARAPGRLDVMGGIADYSGSMVLQMPIREATWVAVQRASDRKLCIASLDRDAPLASRSFEIDSSELEGDAALGSYASARAYFASRSADRWAAYVVGVLLVLLRRSGRRLTEGLRICIQSRVPEAKGVSSSAALEVASLHALVGALGLSLTPLELALWAHEAENQVAGAPCGVMDQVASACGRAGKLVRLLCQPAEILGFVEVPEGVSFFGIDSGVRHAVSGSDYGTVRTSAFMGHRILLDAIDRASRSRAGSSSIVDEPGTRRYLANVTPSQWESGLRDCLPARITGREFTERWGAHLDSVTQVDPGREYQLRAATEHPIFEHHRCRLFSTLLEGPIDEACLECLGELMYQSHASYSACGLGSDATDMLVALARDFGPARGVYGARITGGGCGGTVAILARTEALSSIEALAERYFRDSGRPPTLFLGTSSGAAESSQVWLGSRFDLQE